MTPDCRWARAELDRHLDDESSPADALRLDTHLTNCAACASVRDELVLLDQLLYEAGVEPRVVPIVATSTATGASAIGDRSRVLNGAWGSLAATLLLSVALLLALSNSSPERPGREPVESARFEVSPRSDSLLAVDIPSENPHVKIVWLYEAKTNRQKGL